MKWTFIVLVCSLLVLAACTQKAAESEQSIQDLVNEQPAVNETKPVVTPAVNQSRIINATVAKEETVFTNETPLISKKCRFSAILNGGCKWTTTADTEFRISIFSASPRTLPGVWFFVTGESGNVKIIKRTEQILAGGSRTYQIDYASWVKELGAVTRLEIYPIELMNGTEYACYNQRVYTIPSAYCKSAVPINIDNITSS